MSRLFTQSMYLIGLGLLALVFALPFLWMGLGSFLGSEAFSSATPHAWPDLWHPGNYRTAWESAALGHAMVNSLLVAGLTAIGQVLTGAMAGYVFARMPFRRSEPLFLALVALWSIPAPVLVVPLFAWICKLGWFDSPWALVMPGLASATSLLTFRQTFRDFPGELADAACLDGCSPWQTFWRVALPGARAAIATVGLLAFVASWNSFFWPLLVTQDETWRTLPVGLAAFRASFREVMDWGALLAAATIATMPLITVFWIAQKHVIPGLLDGSLRD